HLIEVRVKLEFAVDVANTSAADRAHERNAGKRQCSAGGDHGQDVRIVLKVVLNDGDHDLGVGLVALCEERADRAVDQAGDQRLLLGRTAFTLEVATGDLAGSKRLFLIVDGKRKEVEARLRLLGGNHRRQNYGLTVGCEHCAVGLTGD